MEDLEEIMMNYYPIIQPGIAFLGGFLIGISTRIYQQKKELPKKSRIPWSPVGSFIFGVGEAAMTDSSVNMCYADIFIALSGDYLGKFLVDNLFTIINYK